MPVRATFSGTDCIFSPHFGFGLLHRSPFWRPNYPSWYSPTLGVAHLYLIMRLCLTLLNGTSLLENTPPFFAFSFMH